MAGTDVNSCQRRSSRAATLFGLLSPVLPDCIKRWVRRLHYIQVVRNFDTARWPGADVLRKLVGPGDVVFDIGANIGYTTKLMADWVTSSGRVFSFEPIPGTYDVLQYVMQRLRLDQVRTVNAAVSSKRGTATMVVPKTPAGMDNIYESHIAADGEGAGMMKADVDLVTLDDMAAEVASVRLIKIDVEGHELDVIHGGLGTLRRHQPALFIEINSNPDDPSSDASKAFRLLQELGYTAYVVDGGRAAPRSFGSTATDYLFLARTRDADLVRG